MRISEASGSAADRGIGEGESDHDRFFMFPMGGMGNKMRASDAKVGSLIGHLNSENWRACLAPVRSNIRSVAGLSVELQNCEHPRLIEINKGHMTTMSALLQLTKGLKALSAEYSVSNLANLSPMLATLLTNVKERLGPSHELDSELMVLKATRGGGGG